MPTLEEIEQQIKSLEGTRTIFVLKEVKELPNILSVDECVEKITIGSYTDGCGILVATNKRLLFVEKGSFFGLRVEDYSYEKITSIQYKTGFSWGEITVLASGSKAEFTRMEKSSARTFAEHVRAKITSSTTHASAPLANSIVRNDDFISKLERLAALKNQGVLTELEFLDQKARILRKV